MTLMTTGKKVCIILITGRTGERDQKQAGQNTCRFHSDSGR